MLAVFAVAEDPAVAVWREARAVRSSPSLLLLLPGVPEAINLTPAQRRRVEAIEPKDDLRQGFTRRELVERCSALSLVPGNSRLLALLRLAQRARLRCLQFQILGTTALFEDDLRRRLGLRPSQARRVLAEERAYAAVRFGGPGGPSANDPPPYNDVPDPQARQALDGRLLAILSPDQRRRFARMCGKRLPSLAAITPHTG